MHTIRWWLLVGVVMGGTLLCVSSAAAQGGSLAGSLLVYIGTYTQGKSEGIYLARFDAQTGRLGTPELAATAPNPTFLTLDTSGRFLYAAEEINNFGPKHEGAVSAYRIEPASGRLALLNRQASGGSGPCHLELDRTGKCLLVANYGSGSVAALGVHEDGSLSPPDSVIQHRGSGPNPERQEGPHAHFITVDPANRFALACDLGLDRVLVYRLDPYAPTLTPNNPPSIALKPGSGPRHLAFHPNGRWVFLLNEMGSTLTLLTYDAERGVLAPIQTLSTLPDGFSGESTCAEVQVHPTGKTVYASNRGHDSIAVFAIDPATGRLTLVQHQSTQGKTPRHFGLDPIGRWLLAENQVSGSIVVMRVDALTGRLAPCGEKTTLASPVCLRFLEAK